MKNSAIITFWDALRPGWIDEARFLVQRDVIKQMVTNCRPSRGRALNAGCGEGLYAEVLESVTEFTNIVHVDIHRPSVAQRRSDQRHRDVCGSLTALPLAAGSIDFCLCSEVIEHIPDDSQAIAELHRVLKPGGWLLISVPTPPAPYDAAHVREGYTVDQLSQLLMRHGFHIQQHRHCLGMLMRNLYSFWQYQFVSLGRRKRSLVPRFLILLVAYADKHLRLGKPWDLVMLARKSAISNQERQSAPTEELCNAG